MMKAAAISMTDKLQAYKCDKLLGGELWNPSEKVKSLLANLEPTNDDCANRYWSLMTGFRRALPTLVSKP